MNDFIILESCDGVGKTTLANLLIHKGYESLHFNYDPNLSIKEKYSRILSIPDIDSICILCTNFATLHLENFIEQTFHLPFISSNKAAYE